MSVEGSLESRSRQIEFSRVNTEAHPVSPGLVLASALCAALFVSTDSPTVPLFAAAVTAALAAAVGEGRVALFCFGLSVTAGVQTAAGLPIGSAVLAGLALGATLRAATTRAAFSREIPLLAISIALALYWVLDPPATNAGYASAYALILLPLSLFVLRFTLRHMKAKGGLEVSFALGLAVSVGSGLLEAYRSVGQSYSAYESARLFESSIGSSNFAAGLAVAVGVLLLAVATSMHGIRRALFLVLATPFLAAPIVLASRGAVVALVAGGLALALARTRSHRAGPRPRRTVVASRPLRLTLAAFGFALLAVVAARFDWFVWERLTDRLQGGAGLDSGRSRLWTYTCDLIADSPFTGVGPGGLTDRLLAGVGYAYSHNLVLDVVAQLGLFGAAVYLWMIRPSPLGRPTLAFPAIVALTVDSMVEPNMSTPRGAALFAGLAACHFCADAIRSANRDRERQPQP